MLNIAHKNIVSPPLQYHLKSFFAKTQMNSPFQKQIVITNLDFKVTVDDIYHLCQSFGEMVECRMIVNERNESKGYCFITFKNNQQAARARESLVGFKLYGREINVNYGNGPKNYSNSRSFPI